MPRIVIHPDGRREVAEQPTDTPQVGAAPRLSDGTPIGTDGLPVPADPPPPAPQRARRRPVAEATPPEPPTDTLAKPGAPDGAADPTQTEG